jgi:hypothetical protein
MPERPGPTRDPLDRGQATGFGPGPAARGVVKNARRLDRPGPRVRLRDAETGYDDPWSSPPRRRSPMPSDATSSSARPPAAA